MPTNKKKYAYYLPFALTGFVIIASLLYWFSGSFFRFIAPYDQKRTLQIILLLIIPLITLLTPTYRKSIMHRIQTMGWTLQLALLSFFMLGAVSCLLAKIPHDAFLQWSHYVLLLFFSLFWYAVAKPLGKQFYYAVAFMLYICIAAYIAFDVYHILQAEIKHIPLNKIDYYPFFCNSRFFSQFAVWVLPLLPLGYFKLRQHQHCKVAGYACILAASCFWALIIEEMSRSLMVSIFLATALSAPLMKKRLFPWLYQQLIYIGLGYIILKLLHIEPYFAHFLHSATMVAIPTHLNHYFSGRITLYQIALAAIQHHPWLGLGPMHYAYGPWHIMLRLRYANAHPHNSILLITCEWGIPAALCLLFVAVKLLISFIQMLLTLIKESMNVTDSRNEDLQIVIAFTIALFSGLISSLATGIFVMPLSQIMLAIIIGACLALYNEYSPLTEQNLSISELRYRICRTLTFIMIICAMGITTLSLIITFPTLKLNHFRWLEQTHMTIPIAPNYWSVGWLTNQIQYAGLDPRDRQPAHSLNNVLIHTY